MTYCLGIKVKQGLLALADTRMTSGSETTTGKKYYLYTKDKQALFLMTSGLRSVRDKALVYFREVVEGDKNDFTKIYQVANAFGEQIKKVAKEDKKSLAESGLQFNLHAIVGGQLSGDTEHRLFLIYPEGNWIEVGEGSPFIIIGNSGYGKPILRRTLTKDATLQFALKTGFLSFDSTRVSANDVDFPIDVLKYEHNSFEIKHHRYELTDMHAVSEFWGEQLTNAIKQVPEDWIKESL
ncbi:MULTISPECIES: peptidase [Reichenbachiella]|uniref:Putative proteasome-type protease n=1 Tax=Reichenbachiella agariperforans TaxID=156994 RepID=A0A1M6LL37_REIAG|nr:MULTISPECIES: peptidase [Reichenbachiella]MBU2913966.1 peptidase [Reichenbachiella agariperforans]RJE74125.1 peptidase [Reichenbachiella sp. MSK19-1]SHJ71907.1 putative proteasome-type protease [Reichenbachiella agariperforans]